MATANAYGSITIVDMTDVGQFSVVPMSNAGVVIIHDPNALNNQYTPASITLTPFTMYGGTDMSSSNEVTYAWYKKTGGATFSPSSPGTPTSTSRTVTVAYSDFTDTVKNITYYVKATYPYTTGHTVEAWGQISISLVTQATNIQDIEISGDHIFKYQYTSYGANPTIEGDSAITLTANCTGNVAVHQWYYWNSNKTPSAGWDVLTTAIAKGSGSVGSVSGSTCIIDNTADIFTNNKAKIKVTAHRTEAEATSTELTSVYDEYEILKLYSGQQGAPGTSSIALIVSNEDQMIPCNGQGVPTEHAFDLAFTTIQVLEGGKDKTNEWTITCTPHGVVGSYTANTHTYTVSSWDSNNSSEVGYVEITASKAGQTSLVKRFSLTKIQTGTDGESPTVYNLSISPNRVATNADGDTTAQVVLTASVIATKDTAQTDVTSATEEVDGQNVPIIFYQWYKDGNLVRSGTAADTTAQGGDKHIYTIAKGTDISEVICRIRKTNASGVQLDSQSVSFVPAGEPGQTGAPGDGAITLDFPQSTDTIGLKSDGTLATAYSLDFPYAVYQGTRALNATASNSTSLGYSFTINNVLAAGDTSGATITWDAEHSKFTLTIPSGTKVYDSTATPAHSLNGQCTIPITYTNANQTSSDGTVTQVSGTILATFTWNLDIAPTNGTSISIDTTNTWTRYKRTDNATQPTILKTDATTVAAAQSGGTKPYYIWCLNKVTYSDGNISDTYTVNYYPVDPENGKSVQTSSTIAYAWSNSGETAPSSGWESTIAAATSGKTKPYYVWTRNVTSYTYEGGGSAGNATTTYSTSYYPADTFELVLQANSTIFNGNVNTITIQPIITKNNTSYTLTNDDTLEWYYIVNGTMTKVTSTSSSANIYINGNNLVVKSDAVNGGTSIQCKLVVGGQTIYEYISLEDYTDEFRCDLYSSIGDKITNGQGSGYVSCLLYRNGQEIHKMTNFSVTTDRTPTTPAELTITTEAIPSDINTITYMWSYQQVDNNGDLKPLIDASYNGTGKAIYIDGSMINKKIMISCEVTITYK